MDYLIEARKNGIAILGGNGAAIVRDAKSMKKVSNRLDWFNPDKDHDEILIFSFTRLYDEKTHKLIKTIKVNKKP